MSSAVGHTCTWHWADAEQGCDWVHSSLCPVPWGLVAAALAGWLARERAGDRSRQLSSTRRLLRCRWLSNNGLRQLPDEIGALSRLESL